MPLPILPTKLFKPAPPPNLVPRPRLLERLEAGRAARLTLVSAPAGYGKSTLLAEWVQTSLVPAAWLSLDAGDNDPVRFWAHFVAALRSIPDLGDPHFGDDFLGRLQDSQGAAVEMHLDGMVAAMAAATAVVPTPFTLVLDDFHLVSAAEIQDSLLNLLEQLPAGPPGLHLVLSSRSDPPWPLARLRVQNQLVELRAKDLRFTREEAGEFLNQVMGLDLEPVTVAELDRRTEGWAAGLQMAALSMQGRADIDGFLKGFTGSHRFVLDYLMEEVLNQQAPAVLDFLLKTSILERLSGPLCTVVTGDEASPEILLKLEKSNLFLTAMDDHRSWYRYHHLFSDLSQKQLHTRCPDDVPALHRRASRWYREAGYPAESVAHALKTDDWEFAARQIETHILDSIQNGEILMVRSWLEHLPLETIRNRPILLVAQAWVSARAPTVDMAAELLAQAEAALTSEAPKGAGLDPYLRALVSSQIEVLGVVIARARGDSTQRQQELALAALDRVSPSRDEAAVSTLYLRLGFCYLDLGMDEDADRLFRQAYAAGLSSRNFYAAHGAAYCRMVIARRHGQLHELDSICGQVVEDSGGTVDVDRPTTGLALIMQGWLAYDWDQLDRAEDLLTRGLALAEGVGMVEILVKGQYALACVRLAQGGMVAAPDLTAVTRDGHPNLKAYAAALEARLNLLMADRQTDSKYGNAVARWTRTQNLELKNQSSYDWEMYGVLVFTRVMCRGYQQDPNEAGKVQLAEILEFLSEQYPRLEDLGWEGVLVDVELTRSILYQALGLSAESLEALAAALKLAEPQGWVRLFLDEGESIRGSLQQLSMGRGQQAGFALKLLEVLGPSRETDLVGRKYTNAGLIDPLSKRELQVLRMLNTRLSVPEIAAEIHLAPSTVRTHIQHIYRKLGVHNRIEALQRAGEIGMLNHQP